MNSPVPGQNLDNDGIGHIYGAEASARLASYGSDLGTPDANIADPAAHLAAARRKRPEDLRKSLEQKLRLLLAGAR